MRLTHDKEFEPELTVSPEEALSLAHEYPPDRMRILQEGYFEEDWGGFPEPAKEKGRRLLAAQHGSRRGGARRRGEVSIDVIRSFAVPKISAPFHQLKSRG